MKNSPGGKQPGDIESPQQKKTNSPPTHEMAINLHSQREKQKLRLHGEAISRTDWRRTWRVGETTRRRGSPGGGWSRGQFRKIQGNHTSASRSISHSHLQNDVRRGRFTQCVRATCPERGPCAWLSPNPSSGTMWGERACGTETRWGLQPLLNRLPACVDQTM